MNATITPRQITRIELDSAAAGFSDPQEAVDLTPGVASRNWRYDINTQQASAVISALAAGLTPATVAEESMSAVTKGSMSASDALSLLGKRAHLVSTSDVEWTGRVVSISASSKDGSPAFDVITDDGRSRQPRLSIIKAWAAL